MERMSAHAPVAVVKDIFCVSSGGSHSFFLNANLMISLHKRTEVLYIIYTSGGEQGWAMQTFLISITQ